MKLKDRYRLCHNHDCEIQLLVTAVSIVVIIERYLDFLTEEISAVDVYI